MTSNNTMNNNYLGFYRPMPQMNPPIKSFNNLNMKSGLQETQGSNQTQNPPQIGPMNYVNPNKTNVGFGRFS